jgi:hypothetical protein
VGDLTDGRIPDLVLEEFQAHERRTWQKAIELPHNHRREASQAQ